MKHGSDAGFDGSFDDFAGHKGRPVLITAAEPSYEEQHRARVRKYLTLMAFRIPALILAALAYGAWHNGLISLAIVAVSIPLPWMAVLIANDRPPRRPDEPRRFDNARRRTPPVPPRRTPGARGSATPPAGVASRPAGRNRRRLALVPSSVPSRRTSQDILRSSAHLCTSRRVRWGTAGNSEP